MLRVFRYFLLFVAAPVILPACATIRYCPIETMQPSKLTFEDSKENISIVAPYALLRDAIVSNEGTKGLPEDSLINNILFTLKQFWENAPGYEDSKYVTRIMQDDEQIQFPCEHDFIVQLERLQIKNNYYGKQYSYYQWEAYLYSHYAAKWTIRNKSGILIDEYTDSDLIEWSSGICSDKAEAVNNLPTVKDVWWDLGIIAAERYFARIVPQWQTGRRSIYMVNKYSELSQLAYSAMQKDSYYRAFNVWETMLLSCRKRGQKKIKSQITHNMAVACEFQNQLEQAIYWAQQSTNLKQNNRTVNYLNILKKREQDRIKLDNQTR